MSTSYFTTGVAPYFVVGTSVFAIGWGAINALLVSHPQTFGL
jgi:hypothetical protein